ncbi:Aste57867_19013 [Aphanomyces stellatus]|uniref:Aste57867_19013 protein n=1 Tax=Aphanomyces stellatus TaxID=120398 RepID=A0A485LD86_9STRA|nr:hypothetical protein As57867_018949 [Aphanomyces stellatus]VFT95738.1 Aste57867_19013 [Aphanomyces stellatus]
MNVLKIAAFSDGTTGGNPAGVLLSDDVLPPVAEMARIAAQGGISAAVFAVPETFNESTLRSSYRVRYFSPESEVPFCGHATIALGAALTLKKGPGVFTLHLNHATITVEGHKPDDGLVVAALQSPPTHSHPATQPLVDAALTLFGLTASDLSPDPPPARIHGGADHLLLALRRRDTLAAMHYDLEEGRKFMHAHGLVTILLAFAETPQLFHTRNPFASGGVYEDPATGAATAALAGYLRDIHWPHQGLIDVVQGEDMGMRSCIRAEFSDVRGSSVRLSGTARMME